MSAGTRDVALADLLAILTGQVTPPRGIDEVHDVLCWMTGTRLQPHQLARASRECRDAILARHGDLEYIQPPADYEDRDAVSHWLTIAMSRYGQTRELSRLTGWKQPLPVSDLDLYECERLWGLMHATFTNTTEA